MIRLFLIKLNANPKNIFNNIKLMTLFSNDKIMPLILSAYSTGKKIQISSDFYCVFYGLSLKLK